MTPRRPWDAPTDTISAFSPSPPRPLVCSCRGLHAECLLLPLPRGEGILPRASALGVHWQSAAARDWSPPRAAREGGGGGGEVGELIWEMG